MKKILHRIRKNIPLLIAFGLFCSFLFLNIYYLDKQYGEVFKSVIEDGLPSLIVIVAITLIMEYSNRRRERRTLKGYFSKLLRTEVGFVKYLSTYKNISSGVEKLLVDEDIQIDTIRTLMIGVDLPMLERVVESLDKIGHRDYNIDIKLLDPESSLSIKRGTNLENPLYQQTIRLSLEKLKRKISKSNPKSALYKDKVKIEKYSSLIPPILMIQFGNEYIAFSAVWSYKSVTESPFCFVPKDNDFYNKLEEEFDSINGSEVVQLDLEANKSNQEDASVVV